ncbi:MAG: hypothetical protein QOI80_1738 [Solirubrobacteraceae bacterium]|jgi:uncharacterized cupin superfamily protein|nr:hypothetical protein [Solirubrobacteraceae bacterium]
MKVFNVFDGELTPDPSEPQGYGSPYAKVYDNIGAEKLAATVAVLATDEWVCPYHYEVVEEEWLFVLEGACVVRIPGGEETVQAGEVVCFPRGPDGAHQIGNTAAEPARIFIVGERAHTAATVYPNSDKVGVFGPDIRLLFRREDARDYWDREPRP